VKKTPLVWLHEYALSVPTDKIPKHNLGECRLVHVWDDAYLRAKDYSLKRLAFIYQTLTTLPVDIIEGITMETLQSQAEVDIFIPESVDPFIGNIAKKLSHVGKNVQWLEANPFVYLQREKSIPRFFSYWKQAERSAFLQNGGK
jgi:hypothetical protein